MLSIKWLLKYTKHNCATQHAQVKQLGKWIVMMQWSCTQKHFKWLNELISHNWKTDHQQNWNTALFCHCKSTKLRNKTILTTHSKPNVSVLQGASTLKAWLRKFWVFIDSYSQVYRWLKMNSCLKTFTQLNCKLYMRPETVNAWNYTCINFLMQSEQRTLFKMTKKDWNYTFSCAS